MKPDERGRAAMERRAGIASRWRMPAWVLAVGAVAVTIWAAVCPAMLGRQDNLTLVATHLACMARTFGLQTGVACLLAAGLSRLAGVRRPAVVLALLGAAWLAPEAWKYVRTTGAQGAAGRQALTVLSVNALYGRASGEAVEREAGACGADVIVFQEYTPEMQRDLKGRLAAFPHRVEMSSDDAFGQAVFSRRAFVRPPEVYPKRPRWSIDPQISVWLEFDGAPVRVTDVHLVPPVGLGALAEQRREVAGLAQDVAGTLIEEGRRVERIVAGDFNGTPDGHIVGAMRGVMRDSWADSSRGRGGTWPVHPTLGKLGKIRIDNLLHSDGLVCIASGVGGETGSDHLPTWARYIRAGASEP